MAGEGTCFPTRPLSLLPAAYQVTHRLNATTASTAAVEVLAPSARQYTATSLKPESVYLFRITAQTRKGWGEAAEALVVTTEKRGDCALGPGRPGGAPANPGAPVLSSRVAGAQPVKSRIALTWSGKWAQISDVQVNGSSRLLEAELGAPLPRIMLCLSRRRVF